MYLVLTSSVRDVCTTTYVSSSLNLEAENSGSDRAEEGSCISVRGVFYYCTSVRYAVNQFNM